jgi:predicted secreted protein
MSTVSGRKARVTVGASGGTEKIVGEISSWDVNLSADEVDTTAFGDGWGKSDVGMKKWSGSCSGSADPTDAAGQGVIEEAFDSGDLVPDIRFYVEYSATPGDSIVYYAPNIAADPKAGARINSASIKQDKAGVATINFSFSGSGPLKRFIETVPNP